MEVWKFLKADFQRTNRNWRLLIVEFITGIIMIPVIFLAIGIPALIHSLSIQGKNGCGGDRGHQLHPQ